MDFSGIKLDDLLLKQKNKVLNIAIILVSALIAVNIYKAQVKVIAGINELKDTEFKKNGVIDEISQYEKKINSYKDFLVKKDTGVIINTIDGIANECGVKIISLKPSGAQDFPLYTRQPFDLLIAAPGYHAVAEFISQLENHNDIYIIDSINMKVMADFVAGASASGPKVNNIDAALRLSKVSFKF